MVSVIRKTPKKYLEGAPFILAAVYDTPKTYDRYTFLLTPVYRGQVQYLGVGEEPKAFSQFGHLTLSECHDYRDTFRLDLIRWLDVPQHVRLHVLARLKD